MDFFKVTKSCNWKKRKNKLLQVGKEQSQQKFQFPADFNFENMKEKKNKQSVFAKWSKNV